MHRLGERKSKFESLSYVNPDQALPRMGGKDSCIESICESYEANRRGRDRRAKDRSQEGSGGNELAGPQKRVRKYISLLYGYYE